MGNCGLSRTGFVAAAIGFSVILAGCASAPSAGADPSASTPAAAVTASRSVVDGVFTAPQAARGRQIFQRSCASCHSPAEFAGPVFQRVWTNRSVGELFEVISTLMPQNDPGGLAREEYVDVITFFLSQNGYPASDRELAADRAILERVIFEPAP